MPAGSLSPSPTMAQPGGGGGAGAGSPSKRGGNKNRRRAQSHPLASSKDSDKGGEPREGARTGGGDVEGMSVGMGKMNLGDVGAADAPQQFSDRPPVPGVHAISSIPGAGGQGVDPDVGKGVVVGNPVPMIAMPASAAADDGGKDGNDLEGEIRYIQQRRLGSEGERTPRSVNGASVGGGEGAGAGEDDGEHMPLRTRLSSGAHAPHEKMFVSVYEGDETGRSRHAAIWPNLNPTLAQHWLTPTLVHLTTSITPSLHHHHTTTPPP